MCTNADEREKEKGKGRDRVKKLGKIGKHSSNAEDRFRIITIRCTPLLSVVSGACNGNRQNSTFAYNNFYIQQGVTTELKNACGI